MGWWQRSPKPCKTYPVPSDLLAWAQAVDVSGLSEHTVKAAEDYLREYGRWNLFVRGEAGRRLVSVIDSQVTPATTAGRHAIGHPGYRPSRAAEATRHQRVAGLRYLAGRV